MGGHNSATSERNGRRRGLTAYNPQKRAKLATADVNSSRKVYDDEYVDEREEILRTGNRKEIQKLLNTIRNEDIDEYIFGQNKTLLLEAVIICTDPSVIDMIMKKGADINKEEYLTGNTALFLSALDLKVEFVERLLKYNPNFQHKNHKRQNIFDFLNYELFEQRQNLGREMTDKEMEKYNKIMNLLDSACGK